MSGYMSKEEFIRYLDCIDSGGRRQECADGSHWVYTRKEVYDLVAKVPEADVIPARPAEWKYKTMCVPGGKGQTYSKWGCSHCKAKQKERTKFCPNCGSPMRNYK